MATWTLDHINYKDRDGNERQFAVLKSDDATPQYMSLGVLTRGDGQIVDVDHPLHVSIQEDAAGSDVLQADAETIAQDTKKLALAAALLFGADGLAPTTAARLIAHIFSGALSVSEAAAKGAATAVQVTVEAATTNGQQLIAANSDGTRRRVVVTNHGTKDVYIKPGNLTAGAITDGELLVGVKGMQSIWFIAGELRATVATADTSTVVSVREEVRG